MIHDEKRWLSTVTRVILPPIRPLTQIQDFSELFYSISTPEEEVQTPPPFLNYSFSAASISSSEVSSLRLIHLGSSILGCDAYIMQGAVLKIISAMNELTASVPRNRD